MAVNSFFSAAAFVSSAMPLLEAALDYASEFLGLGAVFAGQGRLCLEVVRGGH
jgi:hypothetical protein